MAQSPPPASNSSRPPPAATLDGGRLITAGAAGTAALLLSMTAVLMWPRTYGAEAAFVLDGSAKIENPVALAGRIEAALLERDVLASAAMDLPPELRSPDPIGRLRAGIRVQSRGALGYAVEFRGSDPGAVQRVANRLVDRAVTLVPQLTTSPDDLAPLAELSAKTHAVTEFLQANPEITVEQSGDKPRNPSSDAALDLLRTEKRLTEERLANLATDNPYREPGDDPDKLTRRLNELKSTILRREAALKQPKTDKAPAVSPELTSQWRALLSQMAAAQAKVSAQKPRPVVTAHVTSRAALPSSPLTPNRLVLGVVAVLLSLAAAMLGFVIPRKAPQRARQSPRSNPPPSNRNASPQAATPPTVPVEPLKPPSDAPPDPAAGTAIVRSDPPPPRPSASEPPGPVAPMRTVVLSSGSSASEAPRAQPRARRATSPGGIEAPGEARVFAGAATATHSPAGALFGSRPPPGAGSYSVSSSHPPPSDGVGAAARTSVERLSPLQSSRPQGPAPQPAQPNFRAPPVPDIAEAPQIMSRPPALDPEAERWAAHFETPPPPPLEAAPPTRPIGSAAPLTPPQEEPPKRGGAGRWKTQAMGSMIPIEVSEAREGRRPLSEPPVREATAHEAFVVPGRQAPTPAASTLVHHDVPHGWRPNVDPAHAQIVALRDAILSQGASRHLRVAVTGAAGLVKAQVTGALGLALAEAGVRVLVVEADFDNPLLHQVLAVNAPSGAGFSQQLVARRNAQQERPWAVLRCTPTLHVLAEGRMRSPGLLASEEFERAIIQIGDQHHVVLMHGPSLDRATDLPALDKLCQAAVVVGAKEQPRITFGNHPLRGLL